MTAAERDPWSGQNRDYLMAHVGRVRALLERSEPRLVDAESALAAARSVLERPAALDRVCDAFRLSPFERDVLVLCAGVHLDSSFADACSAAARGGAPTFGLALAAFPEAHWSAVVPTSPLRWWKFVELDAAAGVTSAALRLDEWILHVLAGTPYVDEQLAAYVTPLERAPAPAASGLAIVDSIARRWADRATSGPDLVELTGAEVAAKRAIVGGVAAAIGMDAFAISATDLPGPAVERIALRRSWERTCALFPSVLLVASEDEAAAPAAAFARALCVPTVIGTRFPTDFAGRRVARFAVTIPTGVERVRALREALADAPLSFNGAVERVSAQFHFGTEQIAAVAADVRTRAGSDDDGDRDALWDACRLVARPALDDLAARIESSARFDDLVLPAQQRATLRDIVSQARERETVYERWGFAKKGARGLGISALFTGASGTGKTFAAEVIACELKLDLYRIDLSATISKYIGETEKNLRRIFDAADRSGAVLLFDEADALFGKRTEIKDSHDRYANVEVSYLLQRMEAYRGLAILTTNLKSALDAAFLRRLRFVVHFGFPDIQEREDLWRRIFPAELPVDRLDYERLSRLNVSGGTIRNIALGAAFAAAESGGPLGMKHIARAVRSEFIKLERSFSETEIAAWH